MLGALKDKDFTKASKLAKDNEPLFEIALANCTEVVDAFSNVNRYREEFLSN